VHEQPWLTDGGGGGFPDTRELTQAPAMAMEHERTSLDALLPAAVDHGQQPAREGDPVIVPVSWPGKEESATGMVTVSPV
jgi:hypothetical protein